MNGRLRTVMALAISACTIIGTLQGIGSPADTEKSTHPDLTGVVSDQDGKPLQGATVFIYTAGPKEGAGILCPSCYADCRKRATTDKEGKFKIESLAPTLLFRVLVVANGQRPEFVNKVDPALKPIEVSLKPSKQGLSPDQQVKGRVIGWDNQPVAGAVVSIRGVTRGQSTRFGGNDDIEPVAVTDDDGRFLISGESKFDSLGVEVEARAHAKGVFEKLATGGKIHELKLTEGASVTGRLVKQGQPVAGVEIGICGAERRAEVYVGDFSVGTDEEGKFLLVNLPPNRDYILYGRMNSLGEKGAVPARRVQIKDDGSVLDIGTVQLVDGLKLEGQVRLSDGKPVPPRTRVLLSRDEAWDSDQTEADEQGRFRFIGVPAETVDLSARVKGYHLSPRNKSLDPSNPFRLTGLLKASKTDLIVEFDPGENQDGGRGEYVDLRQEPLMGAEPLKERREGDIHVTGTVVDAETKKPIARFIVGEGRLDPMSGNAQWITTRQTPGTNGTLDMFVNIGRGVPVLMVEADGYIPQSSGPLTGTETNLAMALKRGEGPNGVILKPNGDLAIGVKVYMADMRKGVYVQDSSLRPNDGIYQGTRSTRTDDSGRFAFRAKVDDYAILVLDDAGFAQVTVSELSRNPEVKLQPWAKIEGKLLIGTRPGTNEIVRLGLAHLPYEYHPRDFAPLSLFLQTKTDSSGQFSFEKVPPINIQVYHSPDVRDGMQGTIPMSQARSFSLRPGEVKALTLGGQGRPVTGELVVNGYEGTIEWRADVHNLELILPPREEVPDFMARSREQSAQIQAADSEDEKKRLIAEMQKSREEAVARQRQFYATPAGKEYYFQHRRYALNFSDDGSFRVEDVPGGKYRLRVDLREGGGGPMNFSAPRIASLDKEFTIPDAPGGRSDEPFDLGKIEMQARKVVSTGKPAPDFAVKTVDGKTIKLSDFSGKYVLLDFWAVWCGPCVAETPHLKATYEAFKDNPRFAMIGLSLDPKIETPRDYAKKNGIEWINGFLGDWSKADVPGQYGVEGIPSIFLIGPDGKIVAKDLRGANIKATVERTLARAASGTSSVLPDGPAVEKAQARNSDEVEQAKKRVPEPRTDVEAVRKIEPKVRELTKDWKEAKKLFETASTWAEQVQALVEIGKPAVPTLAEILDGTGSEHDLALRLLGFTLRAIDDARAVPALIRAVPRTLRKPGSDCGVQLDDSRLLEFMQLHDLDGQSGGRHFSIGRPVREISGALTKITGSTHGEKELFFVFLEGGQPQRDMQQNLFLGVALRWSEWWKTNWSAFVVDSALSEVRLPELASGTRGSGRFPASPNAQITGGAANVIIGAFEDRASECFLDLDTGRWPGRQSAADELGNQSGVVETAWAAKQGIDVVGTKHTPDGSDRSQFALRGVGLRAWEVSGDRWDTIEQELRSGEPLKLGRPTEDMLMHYDSEKAAYVPGKATFLFITREGTSGILRLTGQAAWPRPGARIEYRCFFEEKL